MHWSTGRIGEESEGHVFLPLQARYVDDAAPIGIRCLTHRGIARQQRYPHMIEWFACYSVNDARVQWRGQNHRLGLTAKEKCCGHPGKRLAQAPGMWKKSVCQVHRLRPLGNFDQMRALNSIGQAKQFKLRPVECQTALRARG